VGVRTIASILGSSAICLSMSVHKIPTVNSRFLVLHLAGCPDQGCIKLPTGTEITALQIPKKKKGLDASNTYQQLVVPTHRHQTVGTPSVARQFAGLSMTI
jgi:hypothetical protein